MLRLSEEPDACYCSGKEHGANSKSQSKGLPCRAYFLAPDFLALDFLVEAFDVGKRLIDAVSGARHWARPPAAVAKFWDVHGVFTVRPCGIVGATNRVGARV